MTTPDTTLDTTPEEGAPKPLTDSEQATHDAVVQGIDYGDTFTLKQAIESFNATRVDVPSPQGGKTLTAAAQRVKLDAEWLDKYRGSFTLRRPGLYDEVRLRSRFAELTNGAPVDGQTGTLVEAIAVCELLLEKKPDWFDIDKLINERSVLLLIYHWFIEWNARFRS